MGDITSFFGGQAFDPGSVEPMTDFAVLPPGKYIVLIEKAEVQATKARDGHFMYLELKVLAGQHKERKLFDRINLHNKNKTCVEIGMRCFAALAQAIGLQAVTDDAQLINQQVVAHVKVKGEYNEIRTYSNPAGFDPNAVQATAPGPAAAPGPTPTPVAPVHAGQPLAPEVPPVAPQAAPVAPVAPVAPTPAPVVATPPMAAPSYVPLPAAPLPPVEVVAPVAPAGPVAPWQQ